MYIIIATEIQNPALLNSFEPDFELEFPRKHYTYDYNSTEYKQMAKEVREFYFPGGIKIADSLEKYSEMLSDTWFNYGIDQAVKLQSKRSTGKTYYYVFSHETELNRLKQMSGATDLGLPGATHADDLYYLFR